MKNKLSILMNDITASGWGIWCQFENPVKI